MTDTQLRIAGFLLACGVAYYAGYQNAPREILDSEVKDGGFMRIDTAGVLSATVESLRLENKLLVFSFKGGADVWVERSRWIILHGRQELFVPAVVSYYVDLSRLRFGEEVKLDPDGKTVRVKLPPLVLGDIAFEPEKATTINGGLLTFSEEEVEELRKINFATARKAIVKQAQGQSLIAIAKRQARENITNYFAIPLRAAGASDVKVVATF